MSLFRRQTRAPLGPYDTAETAIPRRPDISGHGSVPVTNDTALRHSAVWAALRLRANLISTMPITAYRKVLGFDVEVPKPTILVTPGGERCDIHEWLYSTQIDLGRAGNTVGLITERYGTGLPARIDLQPISDCVMFHRNGRTKWRIGGIEYELDEVWHEKQNTVPGYPFGLSTVAYAAWSIGEYLSIQEFATNWFGSGGVPKAQLKNTGRTLTPDQASSVKERFKASVVNGDLWVTGADWEFSPLQMEQAGNEWIDHKQFGIVDIARFFDAPADLIDGLISNSSITYATITQRNLQFLIMHLQSAIVRREAALSRLLPQPRFVKFDTSSLLRMDDEAWAKMVESRIQSRTLTPNEGRAMKGLPPLTPKQIEEFHTLWPVSKPAEEKPEEPEDKPEEKPVPAKEDKDV